MKRAVTISLGSPSRDNNVVMELNGIKMLGERIGTGGDAQVAHRLFKGLDGQADAITIAN